MDTPKDTKDTPPNMGGVGGKFGRRMGIFGNLLSFLWKEKMWWMIPMVVVLGTLALLAAGAAMSGVAPFIYVLF